MRFVTPVLLAACLVIPASAGAKSYLPLHGQDYFGVSDTGDIAGYQEFSQHIDDHPAVLQTFHVWGTHPWRAVGRWTQTQTRGMLSISTTDDYSGEEIISPRQIAMGRGDNYPLMLNRRFSALHETVYIRLLPEMNGHWNPYCAYNDDGSFRGNAHSTKWFKQAWRRFTLIVRGGDRSVINHKLMHLGLPRIHRAKSAGAYRHTNVVPRHLPRANVAMQWVPQTSGSPDLGSNGPAAYWPGSRYVDWVGADIYAKFPNFEGLSRLYAQYANKPFLIGEWSPWDYDSPGFVKKLFGWARRHGRTRLLVYYQAFGSANPHHIEEYPNAEAMLERELNGHRFDPFAPGAVRPTPPPPDGGVPTPKTFTSPPTASASAVVDSDLIH
jgi:hypothetical protein